MARPREFDPDTAILGAMNIFWRLGYKGTNLPDLLRAMGLTRGSFYKAFRDKEAVYLEALGLYDRTEIQAAVTVLDSCQTGPASRCIAQVFVAKDNAEFGCFGCNAMVEMAPVNPKVAERTSIIATRFRDAVRALLLRLGSVPDEATATAKADVVLTLFFGSKTLAKSGVFLDDWEAQIAGLLGE